MAEVAGESDEIWCLGDVVGYGPRPNECVALVRERCRVAIAGNHDLAAIRAVEIGDFSEDAARSIRWTREVLRADAEQWLASLAPSGTVGPVGLYHGSPRDPIWEYVIDARAARGALDAAPERTVLVGHTHVAVAATIVDGRLRGDGAPDGTTLDLADGRRWLLNPGSVGQPRDRDPRAAVLVLEVEDGEPTRAVYRRVPYDWTRTQEEIRAAALPERLAERLAYGI